MIGINICSSGRLTHSMLSTDHQDKIFATDKLQHLLFGLVTTLLAYSVCSLQTSRHQHRLATPLLIAISISLCLGLLKEVGDSIGLWPGIWSLKDLLADVLGTLLAAFAIRNHQQQSTTAVEGTQSSYHPDNLV